MGSPRSAIASAENIALLHLLHSVPALPTSNPADIPSSRNNSYALSFKRERGLTGTLAFLSNMKDDPDHIPAVCLEECTKSAGLNVILAVEKATSGDGGHILRQIKHGLEEIFKVLSRVSDETEGPGLESDIFAAIISVCSSRILCRLRIAPNKRGTLKKPIQPVLQEASDAIGQLNSYQLSGLSHVAQIFKERAQEVMKLVDLWAKYRTTARLGNLVEGVFHLWQVRELPTLLNAIPNRFMNPSARRNLLNITGKVARYREAAKFLYGTARKYPLVRKINVIFANLPQEAFQRAANSKYTSTFDSTISRISRESPEQYIGHISRVLGMTRLEASDQFAEQTRKTLNESKIHAEIQLLFYTESNCATTPARVICSSKDACFLCNAFILAYGKIYVPRHHGRLYPGWRLPFLPKLFNTEQEFNTVIESHIRLSLTALRSRRQKTIYPDPNESTLLTLPRSVSTLRSGLLQITEGQTEVMELQTADDQAAETSLLLSPSHSGISALTVSTDSLVRIEHVVPVATGDERVSSYAGSQPASVRSFFGVLAASMSCGRKLVRGQLLRRCIATETASRSYIAGLLEVFIDYATETKVQKPHDALRRFSYSIEWLTAEEVERLQGHPDTTIVNGELLEGETTYVLDERKCLHVAARGSVLRILF